MATFHSTPDLAARIDRLERRNRVLGAAVAGLLLLFVLPAFAPQGGPAPADGELRAKRFVLVDGKDQVAGSWETDKDGKPRFELFDGSKKARLSAQVTTDDVVLALRDREGLVRTGLAVGIGGLPHVLLSDAKGRPRLHLSVNVADRGNLIAFGPEGGIVAGLGVEDDGDPWLLPAAGNGTPAAAPKPAEKGDGKAPMEESREIPSPGSEAGGGTRR